MKSFRRDRERRKLFYSQVFLRGETQGGASAHTTRHPLPRPYMRADKQAL